MSAVAVWQVEGQLDRNVFFFFLIYQDSPLKRRNKNKPAGSSLTEGSSRVAEQDFNLYLEQKNEVTRKYFVLESLYTVE